MGIFSPTSVLILDKSGATSERRFLGRCRRVYCPVGVFKFPFSGLATVGTMSLKRARADGLVMCPVPAGGAEDEAGILIDENVDLQHRHLTFSRKHSNTGDAGSFYPLR